MVARVQTAALGFFAVAVVIAFPDAAHAQLRVVAVTGQPAPGTGGLTISSVAIPSLNEAGYTAFGGTDNANTSINNFVWSEGAGSGVALVAHEGSPVPGMPFGVLFGELNQSINSNPNLSDNGMVGFTSPISGTGVITANDLTSWKGATSAGLQLIAREGSPANGTPSGVNYSFLGGVRINSTGHVAFPATLVGTGITTANDTVIYTDAPGGGLTLVAQEGAQAVGAPAGVSFGTMGSYLINDNGGMAISATLTGSGVTTANDNAIWRTTSGTNLALFAREGDHAPGTPSGDIFASLGSPVYNNAGHVAFASNLSGSNIVHLQNESGIWSDRGGELALDYRAGDTVNVPQLGSGYSFSVFAIPVMNHDSRLAFCAGITGPTSFGAFFNEGRTGSLEIVAGTGLAAPGTADGVTFTNLTDSQLRPAMNAHGQIAFIGRLAGTGVTTANDNGIWATDTGGTLHLIAREGDTIDVDPSAGVDLRTINVLSMYANSNNEDGGQSAFNNSGQIAFLATFVGGGSGVFVSNAVAGLPGDFNGNGIVDAADYVVWRKNLGTTYTANDYSVWRSNFGQGSGSGAAAFGSAAVPEPSVVSMAMLGILAATSRRMRTTRRR